MGGLVSPRSSLGPSHMRPPPPSAQIRRAAARPSPPALRRRHPGPCRRAVAGRDVPRGGGGGGMGSRYRITERKTARWGVGCGKVPRGNLRISLVCRGGRHVSAMRNAVMYAHIYMMGLGLFSCGCLWRAGAGRGGAAAVAKTSTLCYLMRGNSYWLEY